MTTKKSIDDLAIFGGAQAFSEQLHVGRPNIGDRKRLFERINDLLDRRWLTNQGPLVQELEKKLADYLGVKHCVAMGNGTVAMEIATKALQLSGEVILPSFSFVSTAHALQWQEIKPVFCDIDPQSHNIDPEKIEELITERTTAIIATHLWGRPCDIDVLTAVAKKHNLKLLFDAAHAIATTYKGKMIGGFGDAEIFSFHATKVFNTIEGGAITTNNDELADKARLMKNFGFRGYDNVIYLGKNGKMNEMSAAMGLTSLESLDEFIAHNRNCYQAYQSQITKTDGITLVEYDDKEKANYQYAVIDVDEETFGISRDQLVDILHAENIIARKYFYPGNHRMEPYQSISDYQNISLTHTDRLAGRVMSLPTGSTVTEEDIAKICAMINFVSENADSIKNKKAV